MARIKSSRLTSVQDAHEGLIDAIFKALKEEEQADQPVIFEVAARDTDYLQIIVVWERWADISSDIRNRLVIDAYKRFEVESPEAVDLERISMILPVTAAQAIEMGILPYSVMSSVHRRSAGYDLIEQLMKAEGAIQTDAGTELRLPTLEMAKDARDRLQELTKDNEPEVHWQITQQMGRIIDY